MQVDVRVARVCLDLNVFFAALRGREKRISPSAASDLVDMALSGQAGTSAFQLVTSVPMLENWANILQRHFRYTAGDAQEQADILFAAASDGPLQIDPLVVVRSGFVPFATDEDVIREAQRFTALINAVGVGETASIFDEITDDRHVFLTALAGRADLLVTSNIQDFRIRKALIFTRDDVLVIPNVGHTVVVCKPGFAAYHLRRGICPSWAYLKENAEVMQMTINERNVEPNSPTVGTFT